MVGKQHRVSFFKENHTIKKNLCVGVGSHIRVWSYEVQIFNGDMYFMTFIDDYSKKLWTYMIRSKDQVLHCFQKFHVAVERETELSLKVEPSDSGGEYTGLFEKNGGKHGIKHERTVSNTPQQNGLAKRMNHTICEKVRSMLLHAKLSKHFGVKQCVQQQTSSISLQHIHWR